MRRCWPCACKHKFVVRVPLGMMGWVCEGCGSHMAERSKGPCQSLRPLPATSRPLPGHLRARPLPGHFPATSKNTCFFPRFSPPATSRPLPAATCEATSRPLPGHMGGCEVGRRPLPGHFAACEVSSRPHLSRQLETPHSRAVPSQGTQEVKRCAQQAPKEGVLPCARPPPQGII